MNEIREKSRNGSLTPQCRSTGGSSGSKVKFVSLQFCVMRVHGRLGWGSGIL